MKEFKFTNFFNALSPILEEHEEEVFYKHPVYEIQCNQLGALYFDDEVYTYKQGRNGIYLQDKAKKTVGSKGILVWECYRGVTCEAIWSPYVYHLNGNLMDYTPDNISLAKEIPPDFKQTALKNRNTFVINSVNRLMQLEQKYLTRGIDKSDLNTMFAVPKWLSMARNKVKTKTDKERPKRTYVKTVCKITDEETERVINLFMDGWGQLAIAEEMGWRSRWRVKKIITANNLNKNGTSE
jgi:hypothetical protein